MLLRIPVRSSFFCRTGPLVVVNETPSSSAMIDATCSYAWLANEGGFVSTVDLRTDFHRPLPKGRITIRADIVRAGRSIITVDARIADADGRLMASGRAVMMRGSKAIAGSAG